MAKRPTVPKFGNWGEDDVPYTVYFDKARKGKTSGKMINPNDPQENPEMFGIKTPSPPAPPPRSYDEPVRPTPNRRANREDNEYPPANDNMGRRTSGGSAHQRGSQGVGVVRPVRNSGGSEHSFDRSPLHPHYRAKVGGTGKGAVSPAWEGNNSYDSSHGTPVRSKMKPTPADDSPGKGSTVPRFGDWDENNPSSGDNYTHIFNKVREERVTGPPLTSGSDARPNYNIPKKHKPFNKQPCCFPWLK